MITISRHSTLPAICKQFKRDTGITINKTSADSLSDATFTEWFHVLKDMSLFLQQTSFDADTIT